MRKAIGRFVSILAAGLLFAGGESIGQNISYPSSKQGGFYTHNYYFGPAPSSTPWAPAWTPDWRWTGARAGGRK